MNTIIGRIRPVRISTQRRTHVHHNGERLTNLYLAHFGIFLIGANIYMSYKNSRREREFHDRKDNPHKYIQQ